MPRLKEIKIRSSIQQLDNDLRGLGTEPVLLEGFPIVYLSLLGGENWDHLITRYGLTLEGSTNPNLRHLRLRVLGEGEHKIQAVTLFIAALEATDTFPSARCFLHEISGLHHRLSEDILGKSDYSINQKSQNWTSSSSVFRVDGIVMSYLNQAGFNVPDYYDLSTPYELTEEEILKIKQSLKVQESSYSKALG